MFDWTLNVHLIFTHSNPIQLTFTCSKSAIKTPERRHDVVLVFLLLTLNIFQTFFQCSIVDFEQVNVSLECSVSTPPKTTFLGCIEMEYCAKNSLKIKASTIKISTTVIMIKSTTTIVMMMMAQIRHHTTQHIPTQQTSSTCQQHATSTA